MKLTIMTTVLITLLALMYYMNMNEDRNQTVIDVSHIHKNITEEKSLRKVTSNTKTIYKTDGQVSISWTRSN